MNCWCPPPPLTNAQPTRANALTATDGLAMSKEDSKDFLNVTITDKLNPINPAQPRKRALLSDEKAREIFKLRLAIPERHYGTVNSLFTARSILVSKVPVLLFLQIMMIGVSWRPRQLSRPPPSFRFTRFIREGPIISIPVTGNK